MSGRSSGVEHNLAKVGVEGSNPFARSSSSPAFDRGRSSPKRAGWSPRRRRALALAVEALLPACDYISSSLASRARLRPVPARRSARRRKRRPRPRRPQDDDYHNRSDDQIVVTAGGLTQLDMLAGTSVLEGVELQRNLAGQIGEVLAKLPGVSATGFSPGASRPVLRGFSGERVRVLVDGIGAIDASNTSADHAVDDRPADRRADRGAARAGGAALRQPGDRRRGQRDRQAHPAAPARTSRSTSTRPPRPTPPTTCAKAAASLDVAARRRVRGPRRRLVARDRRHAHPRLRGRPSGCAPSCWPRRPRRPRRAMPTKPTNCAKPPTCAACCPTARPRPGAPAPASRCFARRQQPRRLGRLSTTPPTACPADPARATRTRRRGRARRTKARTPVSIGLSQYRADLRGELALGDGLFEG